MNTVEADQLAKRIINTWNGGPRLPEWCDALGRLDTFDASSTFTTLRDNDDHAPSIARFLATYHAKRRATSNGPVPVHCELCDGTGWAEVLDDRRHATHCTRPGSCFCTAVAPCRCTAGQHATPVHTAILEHNQRGRP